MRNKIYIGIAKTKNFANRFCDCLNDALYDSESLVTQSYSGLDGEGGKNDNPLRGFNRNTRLSCLSSSILARIAADIASSVPPNHSHRF